LERNFQKNHWLIKVALKKTRPTIQFRVPNSGVSQSIYPEYDVAILRANNEIVIISGERVYKDELTCEKNKKVVLNWITQIIPNSKLDQTTKFYSSKQSNIKASLSCIYNNESPYPTLRLQLRGKKQDKSLKSAWQTFFNT